MTMALTMSKQRVMFEGVPRTHKKRGSARQAALLTLLEEHEGARGMVMVGAGKDIDPVVARRLVAARLAVRDSGDPGTWLRLTPAGVAAARDIRIREMPKGV